MKKCATTWLALLLMALMLPLISLADEPVENPRLSWSKQQWEDHYAALDQEEREKRIPLQQANGLPYPGYWNVELGGVFLTMDSMPLVGLLDHSFYGPALPLRSLFTQLGAEIAYNPETAQIAVTGPDGRVTLLNPHDTLPPGMGLHEYYIGSRDGKAYVSYTLLQEVFPFRAFLDYNLLVVRVLDLDKKAAEIDARFTILNQLLSAMLNRPDKTYEADLQGTTTLTAYGEKAHDTATFRSAATGLIHGNDVQVSGELRLDTGRFSDTLFKNASPRTRHALEALRSFKFEAIRNSAAGASYVRGPALDKLIGLPVPEGAWLMDFWEVSTGALRDAQEILTVGRLIVRMYASSAETYDKLASVTEVLAGDSAFTARDSGSGTTYTLRVENADLLRRGDALLADNQSYQAAKSRLPDIRYQLEFTMEQGKLKQYAVTGSVKSVAGDSSLFEGVILPMMSFLPGEATIDLKGDGKGLTAQLGYAGTYIGKIVFDATATWKESAASLLEQPPAHERCVTREQLIEMRYREPRAAESSAP